MKEKEPLWIFLLLLFVFILETPSLISTHYVKVTKPLKPCPLNVPPEVGLHSP